ncbi:hypothetical protein R1sor_003630 [Riccia sorocarpa]|uniref:Uncharacterized protein n=1 Tax=Riccia sorocarpa TaxID=122646 RepID=A0ABD3H254_9MARC
MRTILPMATSEHDDLASKGKGGVLNISEDIGSNDKYFKALSSLRFKLLLEKKSHSSMWEFLELCHTYSVDLTSLGKSGAAGTSTSGEGLKKQKVKAAVPVKKLKVVAAVPPKKPTTWTVQASKPKTATQSSTPEASKQKTRTPGLASEASKLRLGTLGLNPEASKLKTGTSADTTGKKLGTKSVRIIPPTQNQPSVPSIILPSKLGSSSGHADLTTNAPEADNTRRTPQQSSPQQSVQPLTVNPVRHSADGGSVVDSGKNKLQGRVKFDLCSFLSGG